MITKIQISKNPWNAFIGLGIEPRNFWLFSFISSHFAAWLIDTSDHLAKYSSLSISTVTLSCLAQSTTIIKA
jgi:hypothetical protein